MTVTALPTVSPLTVRLLRSSAGVTQPVARTGNEPCVQATAVPEQWFREDLPEATLKRHAAALCSGCPARDACLQDAISNDIRWGIWGGRTTRQRDRLTARRAS
jgi:hypothetical protein